MATTFLENGKEICAIDHFDRHRGPATRSQGTPEPDFCTFDLPHSTSISLGRSATHELRSENASSIPIRITRVTGGVDGVKVTALLT